MTKPREFFLPMELGRVVQTRASFDKLHPLAVLRGLERHKAGDWGEVCPEDRDANETALRCGLRILSAYDDPDSGERFWIITEADRSSTTVLLPEDY